MEQLTALMAHLNRLQSVQPTWLSASRMAALEAFALTGFPSPRDEEWQFLPANAFSATPLDNTSPNTSTDFDPSLELPGCLTIAFVDGILQLPLPTALPGVEISSLQAAEAPSPELLELPEPDARHGISSLTAALAENGVVIRIKAGTQLKQPIHLIHQNTQNHGLSATRHFVLLESHSEATIIETHSGCHETPYHSLSMTRIQLGENASLDHYSHQSHGNQGRHFEGLYAHQAPSSRFRQTQATLGGLIHRSDIHSYLERAAECDLQGVFLAQDRSQIDTHTRLRHAGPHATSRDDYRGMAAGRGRGVFQGRIIVEKGAQKTQAEMQCRNLLLSTEAEIDAKPQLEIYADDVKCAHGLTVGQLDPGAIFYLASRGIGEEEARQLLTFGFANEILEKVRPESLQQRLQQDLSAQLNRIITPASSA